MIPFVLSCSDIVIIQTPFIVFYILSEVWQVRGQCFWTVYCLRFRFLFLSPWSLKPTADYS